MQKNRFKNYFAIIKNAVLEFGSNNPVSMAGTTAYFAIFSIAPILIIIISTIGFLTSDLAISEQLFDTISDFMGSKSSSLIKTTIENYEISENSVIGVIIGGGLLLISATTLFSTMQASIDYIWRIRIVSDIKKNILNLLKIRLMSFLIILCIGILMIILLILDTSLSIFQEVLSKQFEELAFLFSKGIKLVIWYVVTIAIFTFIYRFMPDAKIKWSAAGFGAIVAGILLSVARYAIEFVIGNSQLGAVYGAAGSLVILLIWIYYVSLIFYFGVELCHQYALFYNHEVQPSKYAEAFKIKTTS